MLGVAPTASPDEIRRRYRQLVKQTHPDARPERGGTPAAQYGGGGPALGLGFPPDAALGVAPADALESSGVELFLEVRRAYEVLRDPTSRAVYDRERRLGGARGRYQSSGAPAGTDANATAAASEAPRPTGGWGAGTLESFARGFLGDLWLDGDAAPYPGGEQDWQLTGGRARPRSGAEPAGRPAAGHSHQVELSLAEAFAGTEASVAGVRVRIPPGARHEMRYRVPAPLWEIKVILRRDRRYAVEGDDLATELVVDEDTAVTGGEVKVPHPTGPLVVILPSQLRQGQVLRLRGQGFPATATRRAGDYLIRISISARPADGIAGGR